MKNDVPSTEINFDSDCVSGSKSDLFPALGTRREEGYPEGDKRNERGPGESPESSPPDRGVGRTRVPSPQRLCPLFPPA